MLRVGESKTRNVRNTQSDEQKIVLISEKINRLCPSDKAKKIYTDILVQKKPFSTASWNNVT